MTKNYEIERKDNKTFFSSMWSVIITLKQNGPM